MKLALLQLTLSAVLVALLQIPSLGAETGAAGSAKNLARSDSVLVSVTASVEAVDQAKREVTLKGPLGNAVTFVVDERVKRLNEVKVGDLVSADYYVSVAAELRKPTPEEEKTPIVQLEAGAKAPPGTSPGAGGLRRFRVVTTVEGLDRPTETVTVKGPLGRYVTLRVANPANLTAMRIGDSVIVTYTEALAISLEKVEQKRKE
jgi:hypothetical protein